MLKQEELQRLKASEQIFILLSLKEGLFDTIPIEKIKDVENTFFTNISTLSFPALKH